MSYCVFCEIIAKRSPARVVYEDDDVIVFHNVLNWVPVMLLAVPKEHMMQEDLWSSPLVGKVARAATAMGQQHCPKGFRLVSNVGPDAMQSQPHAHVHIVGGVFMGATGPIEDPQPDKVLHRDDACIVAEQAHKWVPVLIAASPSMRRNQFEFWSHEEEFSRAAAAIVAQAQSVPRLRSGYRLAGNFGVDCGNNDQIAHLHALGGIFLGEYVDT